MLNSDIHEFPPEGPIQFSVNTALNYSISLLSTSTLYYLVLSLKLRWTWIDISMYVVVVVVVLVAANLINLDHGVDKILFKALFAMP